MPSYVIDANVRKRLVADYAKAATPMLVQIKRISTSPASKMQKALREFDQEAQGLTEKGQPISQDNSVLQNALRALGEVFSSTESLIKANDGVIQASGQKNAPPAVTAKVFIKASDQLTRRGVDPLSLKGQKELQKTVDKSGANWIMPKDAEDFAEDFISSAAWISKMENWGAGYAQLTANVILEGIRNGVGPIASASQLRQYAQNIPVSAAETLTRTLQLTSYREASIAMEQMNGGFIIGKIRICALQPTSCLACIALHGTELAPGERVDDHYNGMCSEFYQVPGGDEFPPLMQADSTPGNRQFVPFQKGEEWFAGLSPERQAMQVSFASSPAKLAAYQDGVELREFITDHNDDVFGHQIVENSLKGIGQEKYYVRNQP